MRDLWAIWTFRRGIEEPISEGSSRTRFRFRRKGLAINILVPHEFRRKGLAINILVPHELRILFRGQYLSRWMFCYNGSDEWRCKLRPLLDTLRSLFWHSFTFQFLFFGWLSSISLCHFSLFILPGWLPLREWWLFMFVQSVQIKKMNFFLLVKSSRFGSISEWDAMAGDNPCALDFGSSAIAEASTWNSGGSFDRRKACRLGLHHTLKTPTVIYPSRRWACSGWIGTCNHYWCRDST